MNKINAVTIKPNKTPKKTPSTLDRATWDPEMLFQFRQVPVSEAYLERLTYKLIDWAKNCKDALTLDQFLADNNLLWETVDNWRKRYERLDIAWKYAKVCLSGRREVGALKRQLDSATVLKTMPMYSDQFCNLIKWYETIKAGPESKGSTINVMMNPIPSLEGRDNDKLEEHEAKRDSGED